MTPDANGHAPGTIDPELLELLCCPETHQSVSLAGPELVARLNQRISAGTARNRGEAAVTEPLDGGLVRADGKYLYPIHNRLPVMLIHEAIPL